MNIQWLLFNKYHSQLSVIRDLSQELIHGRAELTKFRPLSWILKPTLCHHIEATENEIKAAFQQTLYSRTSLIGPQLSEPRLSELLYQLKRGVCQSTEHVQSTWSNSIADCANFLPCHNQLCRHSTSK